MPEKNSVYREATAYCPVCQALETVDLKNGWIMRSAHWWTRNGEVFHRDCGAACKVFGER